MSLQVWLPLTKDLRQQGLSNATVTNNGATFDSMGKLGGCYTFGSGKYMRATPTSSLMQAKAVSVACWVKITSWNSSYDCLMSWADGTGWINSRVTLARNNTSSNLRFTIADGTNYAGVNCTTTLALNTWYHVVGTYDGSSIKIYINGNLEGTAASTLSIIYAGTFNIGGWSGNNYPINGSLNDVRLYNHCLSPMEVKELAKGLVLHYPLNRQGWGQENLILESHKVTGGGNANGITRTYESDGSMKIVSTSGNGNWCSLSFAKDSNTNVGNNMVVGNTYCISCDVKIETGTVLPTLFINSGNGYKQLKPVNGSIITGQWIRVYYNSTWADPGTGYGNISLHLGFSGIVGTYYFKNFKLEKSSSPTSWCPNIADSNNMGLNSTTEYDCSGFCNNGTRTGTFSWSSDTPKYLVSTSAQGSSGAKIIGPGMSAEAKSAAIWVKCAKTVNSVFFADKNSTLECGLLNSLIYANTTNSAGFTTTHWKDNQWNHVVVVNDNGTRRVYVNGEPETASGANNYYMHTADAVYLWTRSDNNSYPFNGQMSDFRIYATTLSAEDVLELYHTAAYIDNVGNTYVYQYIET